VIFELVFHMVM